MGRRAFWGKVDVQNYVIWIRGEEECEEEQVWIQCLNTLDHLMYECHLSPMEWDIHREKTGFEFQHYNQQFRRAIQNPDNVSVTINGNEMTLSLQLPQAVVSVHDSFQLTLQSTFTTSIAHLLSDLHNLVPSLFPIEYSKSTIIPTKEVSVGVPLSTTLSVVAEKVGLKRAKRGPEMQERVRNVPPRQRGIKFKNKDG